MTILKYLFAGVIILYHAFSGSFSDFFYKLTMHRAGTGEEKNIDNYLSIAYYFGRGDKGAKENITS